jgi:hypothetical protein
MRDYLKAVGIVAVISAAAHSDEAARPPVATVSDWKIVREYVLNGVDDHVRVADHPELRVTSFTLMAWVNTADASVMQPILGKSQANGNWMSYMLRMQEGKLSLAVEDVTNDRYAHWLTRGKLTSKKWHHIAATWDNRRGDASDAKLYIDGVEQEAELFRNVNYNAAFRLSYTTEPLYIGRDQFPSGHFKGTIKDVAVIGSVLTPAEIKQRAKP